MGCVTFKSADDQSITIEGVVGTSVMQLATANAVPGIIAECGGSMSCATCHVYVEEPWFERLPVLSDGEQTLLEFAEEPGPTSRLSCQIIYSDSLDGITVRVPENQ